MALEIDLLKLLRYILKRIWLPILCAIIGFGGMYYRSEYRSVDTYTTSATMYVYNGNPNLVNYQYTNQSDLSTAVMLVDTYSVVARSNKVTEAVAERLGNRVSAGYIASSISMGSVSETGVVRVSCTTTDPQLSMDICNAVMDIAPAEIIRVVGAGSAQVIDFAELPTYPNGHGSMRKGLIGALAGIVLAVGLLTLRFLMNRKVNDSKELTDKYKHPLLATVLKQPSSDDRRDFLIDEESPSQLLANYGKLRMNLFFALRGKIKTIIISSAVPGETKSTVTADLAISFAMDGKKVLVVDGDMRKPTQNIMFDLDSSAEGLSNILADGGQDYEDKIVRDVRENLDVLPAGTVPPNPSELLNSPEMRELLKKLEAEYDLVLLDTPPINIVTDALVLSDAEVGMLFVTRCGFSDHREIKKALDAAEFTGINILGMVMTNTTRSANGYYGYRYYRHYYSHYYGAYDKNKQSASHKWEVRRTRTHKHHHGGKKHSSHSNRTNQTNREDREA